MTNELLPTKQHLFQPGNKLGGRTKGARSKLNEEFFEWLRTDFEQHGAAAIAKMREEDNSGYIAMVSRLMPRHLEAQISVDEKPRILTKDEHELLIQVLDVIRRAGGDADKDRTMLALERFVASEFAEPVLIPPPPPVWPPPGE
jgi:hypothetical protein